jgi:hypothetical protein
VKDYHPQTAEGYLETEVAAVTAALQGLLLCCQEEWLQVRLAALASLLLLPLRL